MGETDPIEGVVARVTRNAADNAIAGFTLLRGGEASVSNLSPRYQEACLRGEIFSATNTGAVALSVNTTIATGLILTNPVGSGRNLVVIEVAVALASLPAGQSTIILTGNPTFSSTAVTHTTALTPRPMFMGAAIAPVGLADSAATIPAATIMKILPFGTAATVAASTAFPPNGIADLSGMLVLAPGTCISVQALVTAMSAVSSIVWREVLV